MTGTRATYRWQKELRMGLLFALGILVVACLYCARSVFVPLTLAILFTFILSPLVTFLQRRGVPRIPAAAAVVVAAVMFLGAIAWLVGSQMNSLASQLPHYQENVAHKIAALREQSEDSIIGKVNRFIARISQEAAKPPEPAPEQPAVAPPVTVRMVESQDTWNPLTYFSWLGPTVEPLMAAGLVLVFVVFMLIERDDLRNRIIGLVGHGHLTLTTKALDEAASRISRYLTAQFAINIGYGTVVMTGLLFFGVPYAMVWGFFATCFRYVPLVGPWIAMTFPLTLSLLVSDGWLQPLCVIGLFIFCELLANLVFDPWFFGKSIGVSQTALMVAIAFWTWLWGPPGLIMAAPLTVCLVVLGKYVPQLRMFDLLLGDEPALTVDLQFYQRLLAHDQDGAAEIVAEQLKKHLFERICDELFIPALVNGKRDFASDRLSESDMEFILAAIREIFDEFRLSSISSELSQLSNHLAVNGAACSGKVAILVCAAHDRTDEAAAEIFESLLDPRICELELATTDRLVSEVVSHIEETSPAVVCIAALPPGGLAHARLLCKRLRNRFAELKIVVGRWGLSLDVDDNQKQILAAGADHVGTTLEETIGQLVQLAQYLRPVANSSDEKASSPPRLRVEAG